MADFGSEVETFRSEARAWLEENYPQSLRRDSEAAQEAVMMGGLKPTGDLKLWKERMAAKGWGTPTWPKPYGGGGLSPQQTRVLQEEMKRSL